MMGLYNEDYLNEILSINNLHTEYEKGHLKKIPSNMMRHIFLRCIAETSRCIAKNQNLKMLSCYLAKYQDPMLKKIKMAGGISKDENF
uniref:Uncharacterized protein n=1 Tax=Romanomermis culicivorax TaxID=13658 RepID=A0A915JQR3_ROMCU